MRKIQTKEKILILIVLTSFICLISLGISLPTGPDDINITSNTSKSTTGGYEVNLSGGYIGKLNLTASIQNLRWKAFVGWVNGLFTLEDSSGSKIYDWSLTQISGQVYATRASGTISWGDIACASITNMEDENIALSHTSVDDNLTTTFSSSTHSALVVGGVPIGTNACDFSLNTYVDGTTQDTDFEEIVLTDTTNIIYATILEDNATGFDNHGYDFQMIVPENGSSVWSGIIPYYLYIELR
jgi:hypothetical protein